MSVVIARREPFPKAVLGPTLRVIKARRSERGARPQGAIGHAQAYLGTRPTERARLLGYLDACLVILG